MYKVVLAMVLAMGALPALAVESSNKSAMERVVNLPQDAGKLYLTIAGSEKDAKFQAIKSWFSKNSELVAIRNGTHFNALTTESAMFRTRYAKHMPVTPIVRLQAPEGHTLYEAFGNDIPTSTSALANALSGTSAGCPWRHRRCEPEPDEAAPQEDEQPIVAPEPAKPEPQGVHILTLLAVVAAAFAVGGAIGGVQYIKRLAKPSKSAKK